MRPVLALCINLSNKLYRLRHHLQIATINSYFLSGERETIAALVVVSYASYKSVPETIAVNRY